MGIRYYAYAFDPQRAEAALADPYSVLGADPLADAWGLEPGSTSGLTDFQQAVSESDLLYLDKAWSELQWLTAPVVDGAAVRPAHRMFEGQVTFTDTGWISWVRALMPNEVATIARDLLTITDVEVDARFAASPPDDLAYVKQFLQSAREFAVAAATAERGFVYMIG
jgi:hypothetical protein